jgi:hypothetical protein
LIFPFLRAFYDCLKRYFHNIEFHKEQFLLGFKEESLTLNLLILIAKNYIYKCKLKEKIPNIIEFFILSHSLSPFHKQNTHSFTISVFYYFVTLVTYS